MSPVSPAQLWAALISAGATPLQAAAAMGSAQNESGFDPEALNPGGPSAGVGLWQWETTFYPGAAALRTGNTQADLNAQVRFLAQTGGFKAASGNTVQQAAGNFAANYERCAGCSPGGAQYNSRVANAVRYLSAARSGHWPQSGNATQTAAASPGAVTTAQLTSASGDFSSTCLVGFGGLNPGGAASLGILGILSNLFSSGGNVGAVCFFSKANARAFVGGLVMAAAMPVGIVGLALLVVEGFSKTGAGKAAGGALETVGAGLAFLPGMEGAGIAAAAAGRSASRGPRESITRRTTRRDLDARRAERQSRDDEALYRQENARRGRVSSTRPPLELADDDEPPF